MITEIAKFRKKYPDYGDMDDATLAQRLATKFPDAYGDLPEKVAAERTPPTGRPDPLQGMGGAQQFLVGVAGGLHNVYKGLEQTAAEIGEKVGLVSPETVKRITAEGTMNQELLRPLYESSRAARVGQLMGEALPTAPLPGGVEGGALRRAVTAAATGAGLGATRFVQEGESRGQNALVGGAVAGGASAALSGVGKLANTVKDSIVPPPPTETESLAAKWNIPTTLSEQTRGVSSRTDTLMERVPIFGIKGFRARQHEAAHDAAKSLLAKYVATPGAADTAEANRAFADAAYEGVKNLVSQVPNQQIAPSETKSVAKALLSRYPDIFQKLQDKQTEGILADIVAGTKDVVKKSPILGPSGTPITTVTPKTLTFEEAWTLRKGLGTLIGQARKAENSGNVSREASGQLRALFNAVSNDIDNWTNGIGRRDIAEAFRGANGAYRQFVVKYDVLRRAYEQTTREVGDQTLFSPAKFSNKLNSILQKDKALKTFTAAERMEMAGLANILQVVKRAGQYMENPPTGNRWGPLTVGGLVEGTAYKAGGVAGMAKTAGAAGTAALVTRFLTTTQAGKRLALSASRVAPQSLAMRAIVNQVYNQAPKWAAQSALIEEAR